MTPILLLGAGRMGGALIDGWRKAGAFALSDLMVRDPHPTTELQALAGLAVNPPDEELGRAKTVLLAVKPQLWREAAAQAAPHLAPDAVIVSIAAGVSAADISRAFGGRHVARVMPTTAVAIGQGTASLYAADPDARARAHALFAPVASVADLDDEDLMHAATGVSGSAPAYLYAFVEALEAAGVAAGLSEDVSKTLARSTIAGAAALLNASGEDPAELRRQVTSPGGTTQAALEVLMADDGFGPLLEKAVAAAVRRSKELG
ncbi:pyrroline-5-carboxylate reductase [Caulobacter mirabilis]|uniref:Pyrroline-5-carboxylate reductase n=1 Tax=Caulobacter mirabilis TaxID=69666 RepID=A0A2D2B1G0_9CAUL|nr:pyrroline-5-carboxylate reductase [Caulobacter mirabilis]ATQ44089.1 pyrroline-5-carboxylate reductase [Caulobacter mirabilis]